MRSHSNERGRHGKGSHERDGALSIGLEIREERMDCAGQIFRQLCLHQCRARDDRDAKLCSKIHEAHRRPVRILSGRADGLCHREIHRQLYKPEMVGFPGNLVSNLEQL